MNQYKITNYTYARALKLGVKIKPSTNKNKKIDVFDKSGKKLATVGAIGYSDYPTYILEKGMKYADERRRLYKIRHENTRHIKYSNSWYADQLLW